MNTDDKTDYNIVLDKDGEPWTPRAGGFVCLLFLILVILTAIASLIASVLK